MTRSEARKELAHYARGRTFCLTVTDWRHIGEDGKPFDELQFRVSVLPGLHGEACSQWVGSDLGTVVANAVADLIDPPAPPPTVEALTDAEIDELFREAGVPADNPELVA